MVPLNGNASTSSEVPTPKKCDQSTLPLHAASFCKFVRHLFLAFVLFHITRVFIIPGVAYLWSADRYIETDNVLRSFGYKPTGPCSLPRKMKPCKVKERIHIVLVSAQWDKEPFTRMETEMSVKSILSSTNCKLFFHFMFSGETEEWGITELMESIRAVPFDHVGPLSPDLVRYDNQENLPDFSETELIPGGPAPDLNDRVAYSMHAIPVLWVRAQAEKMGINISHHSGAAGFSKLFIPQILWDIDRVIYLDVDMIFGGDIAELWGYFDVIENDENLLYFMGDNHPVGHSARSLHPFCSCQLILHLEKLRNSNVTMMALEAFGNLKPEEIWGFRGGDQWIWSMICKTDPSRCKILPKIWNVSGCAKPPFLGFNSFSYMNDTCWQVVHFNCITVYKQKNYFIRDNSWADVYRRIKAIDISKIT